MFFPQYASKWSSEHSYLLNSYIFSLTHTYIYAQLYSPAYLLFYFILFIYQIYTERLWVVTERHILYKHMSVLFSWRIMILLEIGTMVVWGTVIQHWILIGAKIFILIPSAVYIFSYATSVTKDVVFLCLYHWLLPLNKVHNTQTPISLTHKWTWTNWEEQISN